MKWPSTKVQEHSRCLNYICTAHFHHLHQPIMLVLIAGITGNMGQKLTTSLLSHGHHVRGLGRSPSKLPSSLSTQLESFIQSTAYHDIPALDKACTGVDAVICAYSGTPELLLE